MGNFESSTCSNNLNESLIQDYEYIENFRETFWDIDFIGMKFECAIKIFQDNGYENIILSIIKINPTSTLKKQVVIVMDEDEKYVIEKPYFI